MGVRLSCRVARRGCLCVAGIAEDVARITEGVARITEGVARMHGGSELVKFNQ